MASQAEIQAGKAAIQVVLDDAAVQPQLQQLSAKLKTAGKMSLADVDGTKIRNVGLGVAAAGAAMTATFGGMGAAALKAAGDYERTQIAFETMLGSAEESERTLADLSRFAATTPFQMPEITVAARQLIMFGDTGDKLMDTLRMLGDAASGSGANFQDLVTIYNQIRGAGKMLTQDFRQLAERGVLSAQDLADYYGVANDQIGEMLSRGEVKFADVQAILAKVTSEGGRFANMMEKDSKSLQGMGSTLRDNVGLALRQVGQDLLPLAKGVTEFAIGATNSFGELDAGTRKLIAGTILVGTALGGAATAGGTVIAVTGQMVTWYNTLTASVAGAKVAQLGLNTAIGTGYVAATGAAVAGGYLLGEQIYDLTEKGKTATRVYQELADAVQSIGQVDFTGASAEDIQRYIAATKDQIAKLEHENQKLRSDQGIGNLWQANADVIAANQAQIDQLNQNIGRANREVAKLTGDQEAADAPGGRGGEDARLDAEWEAEELRQYNETMSRAAEAERDRLKDAEQYAKEQAKKSAKEKEDLAEQEQQYADDFAAAMEGRAESNRAARAADEAADPVAARIAELRRQEQAADIERRAKAAVEGPQLSSLGTTNAYRLSGQFGETRKTDEQILAETKAQTGYLRRVADTLERKETVYP